MRTASTGVALLGQVLEAPHDLTLKLVYADWLEEQGDPFAELIRRHCANQEPDDELTTALAERIQPIAQYMAERPWFVRGMLAGIQLTAGKYAQKATQAALARILSRYGVRTTTLQNHSGKVHACATLAWTTELVWENCQITDYEVQELAESPHLTRLHALVLDKPRCSNDGLRALAASSSLARVRYLGLRSPPQGGLYDAEGVLALVDNLPITSLDLGGTRNKVECAALGGPQLAKLTALALTTTRWLPLARSPHLTELTSLCITAFAKHDEAVLALLDNPAFAKLEHLELRGGELADHVIERLQQRFGERFEHDTYFIY